MLWLGAVLGTGGCGPRLAGWSGDERLVVATPWSESERRRLQAEFAAWREGRPATPGGQAGIAWIPLSWGDDPARAANRRGRVLGGAPDVILGGPGASYRRLADAGRLVAIDRTGQPLWCVARRNPIGRVANHAASRTERAFDDPRRDPIALAWALAELNRGGWAEGYARLVRAAGQARRIGRVPGSALGAVERGEASEAAAIGPIAALRFESTQESGRLVEGVAIVAGGGHREGAQEFLRFLAERGLAEEPAASDSRGSPARDALLADLLGATLVDAQDELRLAWRALERAGQPERAAMWMTQAPPWPPASIRKLGDGDASGTLLQTLVDELAPDADLRAWLQRSWLGADRPVDGPMLAELAEACGGRLALEPRFRAWLRAEWTAWARQRYRRVAKLAGKAVP